MMPLINLIKKYYKYIFLFIFIFMIIVCFFLIKNNQALKTEANRLKINQETLLGQVENYKTKTGKDASRITQLTLSRYEFEKTCGKQADLIKDLNLKIKRLESVSSMGTSTDITIDTLLKDTIFISKDNDDTIDTVKYFSWSDNWNLINGYIKNNNVTCQYKGVDTLNIVATRVPKRFLFFKYGCKYVQIDIVNANPHTKITYMQSIKLKK